MSTPLYMLADDLAGAHDVAVPFAKRGFAVAVPTGPDRLDRFDSADLVVLNTNSRSCGEAEAADHVGAACEAIRARSGTLIYKKIDSTLRGHVGLEIDLVSDLMEFGLVVCAPAYPEMRRTTVGGYQLLHGVPVRSRDMAGPDIPPRHAFIPDLLEHGTRRARAHIDLKTVQGGSAAIREAFARISAAPETTVVVDMADPTGWDGLLDAVLEDSETLTRKAVFNAGVGIDAALRLRRHGRRPRGKICAHFEPTGLAIPDTAAIIPEAARHRTFSATAAGRTRPRLRLQSPRHDLHARSSRPAAGSRHPSAPLIRCRSWMNESGWARWID